MSHSSPAPELIIVTPIYEDAEAFSKLLGHIDSLNLAPVRVVAIDDGSIIEKIDFSLLSMQNASLTGISLKRNVGHQRAIAIGIYYSSEIHPNSNVIIMDSDGEDMPSSIPLLLNELKNNQVDVVVAKREKRVESLKFKIFYAFYKKIFNLLTGKSISFGNFMIMRPISVKRLANMQEIWIHIAGCILASKLRITNYPLNRGARYAGKSKMNFVGLALHGFRGLMVFAEDVLVRVGIACAIVAASSIIASILAISLKFFGVATPGWFSIAIGILLLIFLQTGAVTLMTLMLTGLVRGGSVPNIQYQDFIESIEHLKPIKK